MLVLTRRTHENVVIDGRIVVHVLRVDGDGVKLGIEAPASISVHREEVYREIQQSNREAVTPNRRQVPRLETGNVSSSKPPSRFKGPRKQAFTPDTKQFQRTDVDKQIAS